MNAPRCKDTAALVASSQKTSQNETNVILSPEQKGKQNRENNTDQVEKMTLG